jgi:hypothetical protein
MGHDGKSQNGNKHETDGDNDKIGKKREKPNHSCEDERAEKGIEEYGSDAGNMMTSQQTSHKRTKKIKVERDQPPPREITRSKTRTKTPQRP